MKEKGDKSPRKGKKLWTMFLVLPLMDLGSQLPGKEGDDQETEIEQILWEIEQAEAMPRGESGSDQDSEGDAGGILEWLIGLVQKPKRR